MLIFKLHKRKMSRKSMGCHSIEGPKIKVLKSFFLQILYYFFTFPSLFHSSIQCSSSPFSYLNIFILFTQIHSFYSLTFIHFIHSHSFILFTHIHPGSYSVLYATIHLFTQSTLCLSFFVNSFIHLS